MSVDNLGQNRCLGILNTDFALDPTSVLVQSSILSLDSAGAGCYIAVSRGCAVTGRKPYRKCRIDNVACSSTDHDVEWDIPDMMSLYQRERGVFSTFPCFERARKTLRTNDDLVSVRVSTAIDLER